MWLNLKDHDSAARLMAARWQLQMGPLLAESQRAFLTAMIKSN